MLRRRTPARSVRTSPDRQVRLVDRKRIVALAGEEEASTVFPPWSGVAARSAQRHGATGLRRAASEEIGSVPGKTCSRRA